MRPALAVALGTLLALAVVAPARAAGYPWQDHAAPFDFRFWNHFDMHQQSQLLGNGQLAGFQYVEFTGAVTADGVPVAMHGQATIGWVMHGIPGRARLVGFDAHHDHPLWLVDPSALPIEPGYVHFHWVGGPLAPDDVDREFAGYFLKHTAVTTFFFPEHDAVVTPGIDESFAPNVVTHWP